MTKDEQIKGIASPNRGSVGFQEAQPFGYAHWEERKSKWKTLS
jgi:hypothetical protein